MQGLLAVALAVACAAAASAPSSYAQGAGAAAGSGVPSCAAKLVPCAAYLNSTSAPPAACCSPLKEAAANEAACVCAMLLNKAALQAFGVAPEQGIGLAKRCGVTTDASACAKSTTTATAGAGSNRARSSHLPVASTRLIAKLVPS